MTNQHPISVPDELLRQWCQWDPEQTPEGLWRKIADNSAQWGADQELEVCVQLLDINGCPDKWLDMLRAIARRPKPPSEADLALAKLTPLELLAQSMGHSPDDTIRRALERLKELEGQGNG